MMDRHSICGVVCGRHTDMRGSHRRGGGMCMAGPRAAAPRHRFSSAHLVPGMVGVDGMVVTGVPIIVVVASGGVACRERARTHAVVMAARCCH